MAVCKVSDIFNIEYGNSLSLNNLNEDDNGINFISRTSQNNGCSAKVKKIEGVEPYNSGLITVAVSGSVLESFVQPCPFYTGYHIMILTPKFEMTLEEKIFYCMCLRQNKYRYSYGRQANKTISDILIPEKPFSWTYQIKSVDLDHIKDKWITSGEGNSLNRELDTSKWRNFRYDELFEVKKGKRIINNQMKNGKTPCIRPIDSNNGVYKYIDIKPNHTKNTITVNYNGSVGEAFYQPASYFALDDVNILYPKFKLNPFIAMFLITLIRKEKYRYNYGRKWHVGRMEKSIIKLPVTRDGDPDWDFMENFIKGLPYSKCLEPVSETSKFVTQTCRLQKTLIDF